MKYHRNASMKDFLLYLYISVNCRKWVTRKCTIVNDKVWFQNLTELTVYRFPYIANTRYLDGHL
jgi:hypothetical protein